MLQERRYDLLLLDLKMPGIDGLQLIEALRIWGMQFPVLMISGVGTVDLAVRSLYLGADDFLTKPVEPAVSRALYIGCHRERLPRFRRSTAAP